MTIIVTPKLGDIWDVIIDGDDTLWMCGLYYDAAASICGRLIRMQFPAADIQALRKHCRRVQLSLIRKYGYYYDLYEDAWVETYAHFCHQQGQPVSPTLSGAIWTGASCVHDAPFSMFPGVRDTLGLLRQAGHRLHLLTLGDDAWQRSKVQRNDLEQYFTSIHVIQRTKGPHMRLLAQNPARSVMIGDSEHSDIHPAVALGIEAMLVQSDDLWSRSHKPLPDHVHRISSFTQALALLRRMTGQS